MKLDLMKIIEWNDFDDLKAMSPAKAGTNVYVGKVCVAAQSKGLSYRNEIVQSC